MRESCLPREKFVALCLLSLALVACGVPELTLEDLPEVAAVKADFEAKSVRVFTVENFHGALGDNADELFQTVELPADAAIDAPVVLDGSDLANLSDGQWFTVKAAYRGGLPLVLLHPTDEQLTRVIDLLYIDADPTSDLEGVEAVGFMRDDVGDDEAVFAASTADPEDNTEGHQDLRVVRIAEWLQEKKVDRLARWKAPRPSKGAMRLASLRDSRLFRQAPIQRATFADLRSGRALTPRYAAQSGGAGPGAVDLDSLMEAKQKEVFYTVGSATHKVVLNAWAAHSFQTQEDFYVFRLDTTSSGANYFDGGYKLDGLNWKWDSYGEGVCNARKDGTSCRRDRYLRQFKVRLNPTQAGVSRTMAVPSSDRQSKEYEVSTSFSLSGKVGAGWSEKDGADVTAEVSAGLKVDRKTTIKIDDATLVSTTGGDGKAQSAGWRFEMPDPNTEDVDSCVNRKLTRPFPIQRGSHNTEQWAVYKTTKATRAKLGNKLKLNVLIEAKENRRALSWHWNGFGFAYGCGFGGCDCKPQTWEGVVNSKEVTLTFPLAYNQATVHKKPMISSLTPSSGSAGTRITLKGTDLMRVSAVNFGKNKAETFFPDKATELTVLAPAGKGSVEVSVISSGGISNTTVFRYK